MATDLKGLRKIGAPGTGRQEHYEAVWDFDVDGGATGDYNVFQAENDCAITDFYAVVETAMTSGGSATLGAGITGATTLFMSAVAVGSITLNSVQKYDALADVPARLASGAYVTTSILTAAATAGKVTYHVTVGRTYGAD